MTASFTAFLTTFFAAFLAGFLAAFFAGVTYEALAQGMDAPLGTVISHVRVP